MATKDKTLETNETELNDGHAITYSYYLRDLNIIPRWEYERFFTTKCMLLSTSWRFKMLFQQEPVKNTVSCSVSLKRTDDVKISVMASINLSLSRAAAAVSFYLNKLEEGAILPGEEVEEFIEEVIPVEHMQTTFYEHIDVVAILIIRKCHSMVKTDIERNLTTLKERMTISNE